MPRVVHFEIQADDPERAVNFYKSVFDWTIDKWNGPQDYWLVTTGDDSEPGINGGIMKRDDLQGSTHNTIQVSSVDDYLKAIESAGGKVVVPKMAIPNVGYLAYCQDTEGNVFGIMHPDAAAS